MNLGFAPAGGAGAPKQIKSIFNRRFAADDLKGMVAAIEELPHD